MIIILKVNTSLEDDYGFGFAIAKIDLPEAQELSRLLKLFEMTKEIEPKLTVMSIDATDLECEFYSWIAWDVPKDILDQMEIEGYAIIPDDIALPFTPRDSAAPECLFLMIGLDGFWWQALPYKSIATVETETIPPDILSIVF